MKTRCSWVGDDPLYIQYHDEEWGVPVYDDRKLFEFLILEGAQAGLSWKTILRRRQGYENAFAGFDPVSVAAYNQKDVERLLGDEGIIRNKLKVNAAITNARAFLAVQKEFGTFSDYMWQFVGGKPKVTAWTEDSNIPATTVESDMLSKDLIKRGFKFVGPTICYAHVQAIGMVNDHLVTCFRYEEVGGETLNRSLR